MAVEQRIPCSTEVESVFTFQPKIGELSSKIAQTLSDDFLTRQQKHIEKQKQLVSDHLAVNE